MHKKHLTWLILIFMLPLLACSLLDRFSNAASSRLSLGSETATHTPVPIQAPVVEQAEEIEETTPIPAEPSAPESVAFAGVTGLDSLSSFRVTFLMDFDGLSGGEPAVGRVEMALENTSNPPARYLALTMEGTMLDEAGGYNTTEFYEVGNKIYLYNEAAGDGQWISMESGGPESEAFREGFFAPDEDLELPDTVQCLASPEVVNNVSATHCTFSETDVNDPDISFESLTGNVWISENGNYIVKYVMEATGYQAAAEDEGLFDVGDVTFEYNLMDIDADFTITPPDEALNAKSLDLGSVGGDPETEAPELPVLDDAEELFSMSGLTTYYTNADVAAVVEFYRQTLSAEGWQEDENGAFVDDTTGLLSFVKEGQALTITISKEDGRTNVGLIVTEQ